MAVLNAQLAIALQSRREKSAVLFSRMRFLVRSLIGTSSFWLIHPVLHFWQTMPMVCTGFLTGLDWIVPSGCIRVKMPSLASGRSLRIHSLQMCSTLSARRVQKMHWFFGSLTGLNDTSPKIFQTVDKMVMLRRVAGYGRPCPTPALIATTFSWGSNELCSAKTEAGLLYFAAEAGWPSSSHHVFQRWT